MGVYDLYGNVTEWTQDCWNDSYAGAPDDGSAWLTGDCGRRVIRGGSWSTFSTGMRASFRYSFPADDRRPNVGLRLVLDL